MVGDREVRLGLPMSWPQGAGSRGWGRACGQWSLQKMTCRNVSGSQGLCVSHSCRLTKMSATVWNSGKDMWLVSTQGTPCSGHMRLGGEGACPKCCKCKVTEHDLRTQLCLLESGLSPYLAESSVPWSQHSSGSGSPLSSQRGKLIPASGPLDGLFSPPEMFISSTFTYLAPSGVPFAAWLPSKC